MKMTKQQEQAEIDKIFARIGAENNRAEDQAHYPSQAETGETAAFLRKWSRGKPIVRMDSGATFWRNQSNKATKLTYKDAEALVSYGFAVLVGDPRLGGATLVIKKS